jgi:hypothetical protein
MGTEMDVHIIHADQTVDLMDMVMDESITIIAKHKSLSSIMASIGIKICILLLMFGSFVSVADDDPFIDNPIIIKPSKSLKEVITESVDRVLNGNYGFTLYKFHVKGVHVLREHRIKFKHECEESFNLVDDPCGFMLYYEIDF